MNFEFVYKICKTSEWLDAKRCGKFSGTKKDKSDGYIHFSSKDQVLSTLKKYFSKEKDLTLLKIKTLNLSSLVWEQSSNGDFFPHLYSNFKISNVYEEYDVVSKIDGSFKLPLDY